MGSAPSKEVELGLGLGLGLGIPILFIIVVLGILMYNNGNVNAYSLFATSALSNVIIPLGGLILALVVLGVFLGGIIFLTPILLLALIVYTTNWNISTACGILLMLAAFISVVYILDATRKDKENNSTDETKKAAIFTGIMNAMLIPIPGIMVLLSADHEQTHKYTFAMIHFSIILSIVSLTSNVLIKINS